MGLNFYGRHIKDAEAQKLDHILGRDYINILKDLERKRLYKLYIGIPWDDMHFLIKITPISKKKRLKMKRRNWVRFIFF